jgi:hypothetical protein
MTRDLNSILFNLTAILACWNVNERFFNNSSGDHIATFSAAIGNSAMRVNRSHVAILIAMFTVAALLPVPPSRQILSRMRKLTDGGHSTALILAQ